MDDEQAKVREHNKPGTLAISDDEADVADPAAVATVVPVLVDVAVAADGVAEEVDAPGGGGNFVGVAG